MYVMELFQELLRCQVSACESFRVGITVNLAFLVLGIVILVMMHVALTPREKIAGVVIDELRAQIAHVGYSLYLVAGCAFFGSFPFSALLLRDHVLFGISWSFVLLFLLFIEMTKARL